MKIAFLFTGKTRVPFVMDGLIFYGGRIRNYSAFEVLETTDVKHIADVRKMKELESEKVLKLIEATDFVVLLDEKGIHKSSTGLADDFRKVIEGGARRIVFVVAGAYGASDELKQRANQTWSLSKLTFPHQLVRLILAEQIYRAFTIIRNEPYHHEG